MKMRARIAALGAIFLLVGAGAASALPVTLTASSSSVAVGGEMSVDVGVSGLEAGGDPSLLAYTLTIDFDDSLLDVVDVAFGDGLGTPCPVGDPNPACEASASANPVDADSLRIQSISFLADLSAQPAAFLLATLTFEGVAEGDAVIALVEDAFTELVMRDEGISIEGPDSPLPSVDVTVVPEPGTATLLAFGAGLLASARRTRPAPGA
ncbi:MAG: cohesin domain-containing protein [Myxococcota bacterium]|nr:cohesin domain-containing protein [Myxococcota bacterium]